MNYLYNDGPHGHVLYRQSEFLRDYNNALQAYTVPGYPAYEERLRLGSTIDLVRPNGELIIPYDASQPWCTADFYPTHATKPMRQGQFIDDGETHPPTTEEMALWKELAIRTDQRGMPVHPHAEGILLGGRTPEGHFVQPGGVVTPGHYQTRGPQLTADLLLVAEHENVLQGLFVERRDNGLLAVPGGHVELEDLDTSRAANGHRTLYEIAAIRELAEETGIDIEIGPDELSCSGLAVVLNKIWIGCGADQRATLHAWPQGEAFAAFLPQIPAQKPQAKSDVRKVDWLPLDEKTLASLRNFSNHHTLGHRAIRLYCEKTGAHVRPDGSIAR